MVGLPGYRSKRIHTLVITRKDALEITQALRAAIPSLRITYESYYQRFGSLSDWIGRTIEWRKRGGPMSGLPYPGADLPDPSKQPFPYLESFAVAEVASFNAWVEPPGWKAKWSARPDENGLYRLLNRPRLWFLFMRGDFHVQSRREPGAKYVFVDPPEPRSDDEKILLNGFQVWSQWLKDDNESAAFFNKVLRIVARLTSNSFVSIGKGCKARSEAFEAPTYYYRAGKDACAWALQRRHNYFQDMWKPGNYPYTPEQRYTEDELAAEDEEKRARWEQKMAEVEENIRQGRLRGRGSKRA